MVTFIILISNGNLINKNMINFRKLLIEAQQREGLPTYTELFNYLSKFYPENLKEGLKDIRYGLYNIKNPHKEIQKILLCTTLTNEVRDKAIKENFDLTITHHPFLKDIPEIIFHLTMDESTHGHNVYFLNRMGLKNKHVGDLIVSGDLYKPMDITEFVEYLEKHGFKVNGILHKNKNRENEDDQVESVLYCAGGGGVLLNPHLLEMHKIVGNPEWDMRNVEKDVYVTGELSNRYDLDHNKFKFIIELSHTTSEKPLFKMISNKIKNKWPRLDVEMADNKIDYVGWETLNKKTRS